MPRYNFVRSNKRIEEWEVRQLLDGQDYEMSCIISLLYLTGARISEILTMKPTDVVISDDEIKITVTTLKRKKKTFSLKCRICGNQQRVPKKYLHKRENLKCKICTLQDYEIIYPKMRESYLHTRALFFNPDAPFMEYVRDYVIDCGMQYKPEKKLFRLTRQLVGYYIWKNSKIISPHSFRHSRLQKLADAGATSRQIQAFAGHVSVSSSDPYIESSEAQVRPTKELIS